MYVGADPVNHIDPSGLEKCPDASKCGMSDNYDPAKAGSTNAQASQVAVGFMTSGGWRLVSVATDREGKATGEKTSGLVEQPDGSVAAISLGLKGEAKGRDGLQSSGAGVADADAYAHGHPDEGGTIAPGEGVYIVPYDLAKPLFVVNRGRVGVVEVIDGRIRFTLLRGTFERQQGLSGGLDERKLVRDFLNRSQACIQGEGPCYER